MRGFTVIELVVTFAVLGILAAIAVPNYSNVVARWRVVQVAELLKSTLYYARSEAYRRGGNIVVEKLPNSTLGCSSGSGVSTDWNCGWIVYQDVNNNGMQDANEPTLQQYDAVPNLEITRSGSSASQRIKFDRRGKVNGALGVGFSIVPKGESISHFAARGVCMGIGGRVHIIVENLPCT